jgi:hypothetical protein
MDLQFLFNQPPIRDTLLGYMSDADIIVIREVVKYIERPCDLPPIVLFAREGNPCMVARAYWRWKRVGPPPASVCRKRKLAALHYWRAPAEAYKTAAAYGQLAAVKMLEHLPELQHEGKNAYSHEAACSAAQHKHLRVVAYFHEQCAISTCSAERVSDQPHWHGGEITDYAVRSGSIEMLQWLKHRGYSLSENAGIIAIFHGHIRMLSWLLSNARCAVSHGAEETAAYMGRLEALKLIGTKTELTGFAYKGAAARGDIAMMEYLMSCKRKPFECALTAAIEAGQKAAVDWILAHGVTWPQSALQSAAEHSVSMIGFVVGRGVEWNPSAGIFASDKARRNIAIFASTYAMPLCASMERVRESLT